MKVRKKRAVLKFKQFDNLLISSNIFNTLKKFREKKQVAMWFNANAFDLSLYENIKQNVIYDCSDHEFVKGFDSENSNEDNSLIFINLEHYINAIILNSFLDNLYRGLKTDTVLNDSVKRDLWSAFKHHYDCYTPSIKHRLDKNFFKTYCLIKRNNFRSFQQLIVNRSRKNRILKKIYLDTLRAFQNLIDYLEWDLVEKNKIYQCSLTGLFNRFGSVQSFYRDVPFKNLTDVFTDFNISLFNTGLHNNADELFVSNQFATGSANIGYENSDNDSRVIQCRYISSQKTIIINLDQTTLDQFPCVNLTSNNNNLRDYNYRVVDGLPYAQMPYEKDQNKNFYLGVELEVNKSSRAPRQIVKMLEEKILTGTAICKRDGSLGTKGLELNIVPMTLDYAKSTDYWFNFEKNVKDYLYSYRDKKTGVHVHVPRHLFTRYQIGLVGQFLNLKDNYKYVCEVAGRDLNKDTGYCRADHSLTIKDFRYETDRYSALNTIPRKTIEFRLFKGNISATTMYRYLEFVHALCTFARSNSMNSKTHHNDFKKWVTLNKADYPILNKFHFRDNKAQSRKVESFKVQYNRRFRDISFNVPTLKLAEPLRIRRVRAIRTRNLPSSLQSTTTTSEVNNG